MAFPTVMFGNAVVDDMVGIEDMPVLDMVDGWSKVEVRHSLDRIIKSSTFLTRLQVPTSLKMIGISPAPQFYKSTKAKIGEIADKVLAPYCSLSFRVACSKKENAQLEDFLTWDIKKLDKGIAELEAKVKASEDRLVEGKAAGDAAHEVRKEKERSLLMSSSSTILRTH